MGEPAHSSEVQVSCVNRAFVKQWVAGYAKARPKKCLLLIGPCGCGKSTLAELCFREAAYTAVRVDASQYRNRKALRTTLTDAARIPLKQAVLVEDPEALAADGGLQELVDFGRRGSRIPVVVVCARSKKPKIQTLLQAAEVVTFLALPSAVLARHFNVEVAACVSGDIRQICQRRQDRLPSSRDRHVDLDQAANGLLSGQTVTNGLHLFRTDNQALGNLIHANYVHLLRDLGTAAAVAEDLSIADLLADSGDDLSMDIAGILGTVQPGRRVQQAPQKLHADVLWTKTAFRLARMRALAGARHVFWAAGTELSYESLPTVRQCMLVDVGASNWEGVQAWAPDASILQLTTVLRVSVGGGKSDALVSRVRRALKKLHAP